MILLFPGETMEMVLVFNWTVNGEPQDSLWKIIDLPTLLPVGTEVFINDEDGLMDMLTVVSVTWSEKFPRLYEIGLSPLVCDQGEDADDLRFWMKRLGWTDQGEKHWYEVETEELNS